MWDSQGKRVPNRSEPYRKGEEKGERFAIDFHDFEMGYEGSTSMALIIDRRTGILWDYYMESRDAPSILRVLKHYLATAKRQYGIDVKVIECDNEVPRTLGNRTYLMDLGIRLSPCAPNTQAQNGAAERAGGVIKEKLRAMAGRLPTDLWPEIAKAAVYLLNRTPRYGLKWRTPYEALFEEVPTIRHLRAY